MSDLYSVYDTQIKYRGRPSLLFIGMEAFHDLGNFLCWIIITLWLYLNFDNWAFFVTMAISLNNCLSFLRDYFIWSRSGVVVHKYRNQSGGILEYFRVGKYGEVSVKTMMIDNKGPDIHSRKTEFWISAWNAFSGKSIRSEMIISRRDSNFTIKLSMYDFELAKEISRVRGNNYRKSSSMLDVPKEAIIRDIISNSNGQEALRKIESLIEEEDYYE